MSSKIDERIVFMRFNNSQFEKNVSQTQASLRGLKDSLNLDGAASSLETVASKFNAFGAVAFTALQRVTNAAISFGVQIASSMLDPLVEGGKKRALNIEQAKFQFRGLGMDVEQTMADALYAVKDTAFGLDEAAVAASQFGASGIKSGDEMQRALRGISGVAAMAGSSYSDMADVFTKVAGQGRLMGDDLNRLGARGINAAATLGKAFGKTESEIREMVSEGAVSFQDFAAAMSEAFGDHATKANETYTGSLSNMRAALARIGAAFATADFEGKRQIFNAFTPVIDNVHAALKPIIDLFVELTNLRAEGLVTIFKALNFQDLPDDIPPFFRGLRNIFEFLVSIAKPIRDAFLEIFPPATADQVKGIANAFLAFTERLKMGSAASENLKSTFKGVFALLDIGLMIVKGILGMFGRLFNAISGGSGGVLNFTGNIGDFIVSVRDALKEGNGLSRFFQKLGDILAWPVKMIGKLVEGARNAVDVESFAGAWEKVANAARKVAEFFAPAVEWIKNAFGEVKTAFQNSFSSIDANSVLGVFSVGLLGGIALLIKKVVDLIKDGISVDLTGGMFGSIKGAFEQLTSTMEQMQARLKADMLIKIAIAIGILAASVAVLSMLDTGKLYLSLGAMAAMFAMLSGSMVILDKFVAAKGFLKMPSIASALIALSAALLLLSAAAAIMASLDWNELARGVIGLAAGMAILVGATAVLDKINPSKMAASSAGLLVMSASLVVFASAMKIMASMDWDDIGRSLAAMAGTLAIVVLAAKLSQSSAQGAAAMFIISAALTVLGSALLIMAKMDMDEITRALLTLGGSLLIMSLGVQAMKGSIGGAAAMVLVSAGILIITKALKEFAKLSWDDIGRSLVAMAGSLAILAGAMALMGIPLVMAGSVGILAAAAALTMLAPAMILLGTLTWDEIGRGLAVLASALGILAVAGLLLLPALPGLLGLGSAILMVGGGLALASIGLTGFGLALTALSALTPIAVGNIKAAILDIVTVIPEVMKELAKGILEFAIVIAEGGAEFTAAFVTLLDSLLNAIDEKAPKINETLWNLIVMMTENVVRGAPYFVDAAMRLMTALLTGVERRIPELTSAAANLVITFFNSMGREIPRMLDAGANMVINILNGVANTVRERSGELRTAGGNLANAILDGMTGGIWGGIGRVLDAARGMANRAISAAMNALDAHSPSRKFITIGGYTGDGFAIGMENKTAKVRKSAEYMGNVALFQVKKSIADIQKETAADFSMTPVIRPVLDLSSVRKDASQLPGMLKVPTLNLDSTYRAADALQDTFDERGDDDEPPTAGVTQNLTFVQNNHSPKALPPAYLYRQQQNQISVAREELKPNAK